MSKYHLVCRNCEAEGVHDDGKTALALAARHVDKHDHDVTVGQVTDDE